MLQTAEVRFSGLYTIIISLNTLWLLFTVILARNFIVTTGMA